MTQVVPPGFANAHFNFMLGGDPEQMAVSLGLPIVGTLQAMADDCNLRFTTAFPTDGISSEWVFTGTTVRSFDGVVAEAPTTHQGIVSGGNTLPNNCALLVKKTTSRGGRTGRGRMYLPPFSVLDSQVDARGGIEASVRAIIQGQVNSWTSGMGSVLFHSLLAPGGTDPTPIDDFIVDLRIATQRRRMRS